MIDEPREFYLDIRSDKIAWILSELDVANHVNGLINPPLMEVVSVIESSAYDKLKADNELKNITIKSMQDGIDCIASRELKLAKDNAKLRKALEKLSHWPSMAEVKSNHLIGSLEQREECIAWFISTAREALKETE